MIFEYLFACSIVYIYGSIPFSLLIGFLYGVDIRDLSTGNIGARNLGRNCGRLAFFLGFFLDGSKGLLAYLLALIWGFNPIILLIFAILGHCFSIFLKFKGGRGVSTAIVFALFYAPIPTIAAILIFIICIKATHYLSLSAILSTLSFLIVGLFIFSYVEIILSFILLVCVVYVYRKSLINILKGDEEKSNFI